MRAIPERPGESFAAFRIVTVNLSVLLDRLFYIVAHSTNFESVISIPFHPRWIRIAVVWLSDAPDITDDDIIQPLDKRYMGMSAEQDGTTSFNEKTSNDRFLILP